MIFNFRRLFSYSTLFFLLFPFVAPAAKSVWLFDGERVIRATIASDNQSRAKGLMYQVWLFPNSGMLFTFDPAAPVSFWMKNTLLPLDMRFYDRFGRVLAHYPYAMPCTKKPCPLYPATGNVAYVLETRATFSATPKVTPPLQLLLED